MFKIETRIYFDETDKEGIVFFGNYLRLAHRTLEDFSDRELGGWAHWFDHPEYGVPLRKSEVDYREPLRAGQIVEMRLEVSALSESSVTLRTRICFQERIAAEIQTVHVFLNRKSFKKQAIPSDIRTVLEQHLINEDVKVET